MWNYKLDLKARTTISSLTIAISVCTTESIGKDIDKASVGPSFIWGRPSSLTLSLTKSSFLHSFDRWSSSIYKCVIEFSAVPVLILRERIDCTRNSRLEWIEREGGRRSRRRGNLIMLHNEKQAIATSWPFSMHWWSRADAIATTSCINGSLF